MLNVCRQKHRPQETTIWSTIPLDSSAPKWENKKCNSLFHKVILLHEFKKM